MKYIQVRHWDYWYGIYNIGNHETRNVDGLEFSFTHDKAGEEILFHFDLLNIHGLEHAIAEGELFEKDDPEHVLLLDKYDAFKKRELDYFIAFLYFLEGNCVDVGYDYLSMDCCELTGRSILEIKNRNNCKPYYGVIVINEAEALIPEKVVHWMETLSEKLFLEGFQIQFATIPKEDEARRAYQEDARYSTK